MYANVKLWSLLPGCIDPARNTLHTRGESVVKYKFWQEVVQKLGALVGLTLGMKARLCLLGLVPTSKHTRAAKKGERLGFDNSQAKHSHEIEEKCSTDI